MSPQLSIDVITDEIEVPNYIKTLRERDVILNVLFILSFDTLSEMEQLHILFGEKQGKIKIHKITDTGMR